MLIFATISHQALARGLKHKGSGHYLSARFFCMCIRHRMHKSLSAIKAYPLYAAPARLRSRIGGGRHHHPTRIHKQYYQVRSIYTISILQQCAQCVVYQHVARVLVATK